MLDSRCVFRSIQTCAAFAALLWFCACGVKKEPLPPLPDIPQQTETAPSRDQTAVDLPEPESLDAATQGTALSKPKPTPKKKKK